MYRQTRAVATRYIFTLCIGTLAACGGGGGGSSNTGGATGVRTSNGGITNDNAEAAFRDTAASIFELVRVGLGAGRMVRRLAASDSDTVPCDTGDFQFSVIVESGDQLLSPGDTLDLTATSCLLGNYFASPLEIELEYLAIEPLIETELEATINADGRRFRIAYQRGLRAETISLKSISGTSVATASGNISDFHVQRFSGDVFGRTHLSIQATIQLTNSSTLLDCVTPNPWRSGRFETPQEGTLSCTSDDGSALRYSTNSSSSTLEVREAGGSFQSLASIPWAQLPLGEIFEAEALVNVVQISDGEGSVILAQENQGVALNLAGDQIYLITPADAPTNASALLVLNETGVVQDRRDFTAEPVSINFSPDGLRIYIGFYDREEILVLDATTLDTIRSISLDGSGSPLERFAIDVAEAPYDEDTVLVTLGNSNGSGPHSLTLYIAGIFQPQPSTGLVADQVQFIPNTTRVLTYNYSNLNTEVVNVNGNTLELVETFDNHVLAIDRKLIDSEIYASDGTRMQLSEISGVPTAEIIGNYTKVIGQFRDRESAFVDQANGLVYILGPSFLEVFDQNTYVLKSLLNLSDSTDQRDLLRLSNGEFLAVSDSSLRTFSATDPKPIPALDCNAKTRRNTAEEYNYRKISCPVGDAVVANSGHIYMSVLGSAGQGAGNSVHRLNGNSLTIEDSLFVGSEPTQLALSTDDSLLYVGLEGSRRVAVIDTSSFTVINEFQLGVSAFYGPYWAQDIVAVPGNPQAVFINYRRPFIIPESGKVAMVVDGVEAPNSVLPPIDPSVEKLTINDTGSHLFGYNDESTAYTFTSFPIDANGIVDRLAFQDLIEGAFADIQFLDGRVYAATGDIVDVTNPLAPQSVGRFLGTGPSTEAFQSAENARVWVNNTNTYIYAHQQLQAVAPALYSFNNATLEQADVIPTPFVGYGIEKPTSILETIDGQIGIVSEQGIVVIDPAM